MGSRRRGDVPAELARARDRFVAWRREKRPGSRIPQQLWKLAARLAAKHGLHSTASVLTNCSLAGRTQSTFPTARDWPPAPPR